MQDKNTLETVVINDTEIPVLAYMHRTSNTCVTAAEPHGASAYENPCKLVSWDDVVDQADWLEKGIVEWRNEAIGARLAAANRQAKISTLVALWYQLVNLDHHKDRDCHWTIETAYSYDGQLAFRVSHYGYVHREVSRECNSYPEAEAALLEELAKAFQEQFEDAEERANAGETWDTDPQLILALKPEFEQIVGAEFATGLSEPESQDPGCICKGNWRAIVAEVEPLLDKKFRDSKGKEYLFYGVVHGSDDYYYGMFPVGDYKPVLLSCVGSLEGHGFVLTDECVTENKVEV